MFPYIETRHSNNKGVSVHGIKNRKKWKVPIAPGLWLWSWSRKMKSLRNKLGQHLCADVGQHLSQNSLFETAFRNNWERSTTDLYSAEQKALAFTGSVTHAANASMPKRTESNRKNLKWIDGQIIRLQHETRSLEGKLFLGHSPTGSFGETQGNKTIVEQTKK